MRESSNNFTGNSCNSLENYGGNNSLRKGTINTDKQAQTLKVNSNENLYMSPLPSSTSNNHFTLAINSNIKSTTQIHVNNHITSTTSLEKSTLKRENSIKNIYT